MAPVSRRSFLAGLIAAPVLAVAATKARARKTDSDLTGRIVRSLERRKALGQHNGSILVSRAGFHQIEREHGLEDDGRDITLRGAPCVVVPNLYGDEYWITPSGPQHVLSILRV